jgi:hypothetical protein
MLTKLDSITQKQVLKFNGMDAKNAAKDSLTQQP